MRCCSSPQQCLPPSPPSSLPLPAVPRLRRQLCTPLVSIVVYLGDAGGPTLVLAQVPHARRACAAYALHTHYLCAASTATQVPGAPRNGPRRAWRIWPHAGQVRRCNLYDRTIGP